MLRKFMLIVALGVLAMGTFIAAAQDDVTSQEVIVTYTDEAITVSPAEVPGGLTTFVMDNQTERHVGGPVGRFKDGMTMEDLLAAAQENPFASILVFDLVGSLSGLPDTDQSLTVDLQPGDYVFISGGGQMGNLTVTESDAEAMSELEHDIEVVMSDFAYDMPDVLTAGEQVWQVHNEGEQIHEFLIISVEAETTLDDATEMFRSMGSIFNVMSPRRRCGASTARGPGASAPSSTASPSWSRRRGAD
jgi:hypothetical protein